MSVKACAAPQCSKAAKTRGMCGMHTERVRKYGAVDLPAQPTTAERFWAKVNKTDDCWLWTGNVMSQGYGGFRLDGKQTLAHRVSYQWAKGQIPDGLVIDHLCRATLCVRPSHLEAVTQRVNIMRGQAPHVLLHLANRCLRGHEFTPENTIAKDSGRRCRKCDRSTRRARTAAAAARRRMELEARGPLRMTTVPAAVVRRWAASNGYAPPATGPLSQALIAAYLNERPEHEAGSEAA